MTISINSTMDGHYSQDRLQDLWQQIGSLHLSYLEMEESPQKLDQRNKLEDYIKEFLCSAPHNLKFVFQETADVLHRSANTKKDFSGYKASMGWSAIGMYAANLLNQPWRKEYRQIKLYSGFYKHQIDANLVGAEVMFKAMGYKHNGDGILMLEGPICPDRVISVSQDSLIAYVECQILKTIWEEVSANFNISWLEVLEFRETHLCSPKQSMQALNYRFHERHFQQFNRSYSQGINSFTTGRHSNGAYPSSSHLINNSFPPLHSHVSVPPQCIYGTNGYYGNNYATYAPVLPQHYPYHVPLTYSQSTTKPSHHSTNYFPNGYIVPPPPPPYACPSIPTGQLIEVESRSPHHHYDTVDATNHSSQVSKVRELESSNSKGQLSNSSDLDETRSNTMGSWDYVYKNLESQGYSKDLGERGDLLGPPLDTGKTKIKESKKVKSNAVEEGINVSSLNEKVPKIYNSLNKYKDCGLAKQSLDTSKPGSHDKKTGEIETNLKKQSTRQSLNGYLKTSTLPVQQTKNSPSKNNEPENKPSNSKVLDIRKKSPKKEIDIQKSVNNQDKWQCTTCTFLNDAAFEICEMCGKSKVKVRDTMEIGGSQCPRCTLVNPKDNKICDACAGSLKDSPTYI